MLLIPYESWGFAVLIYVILLLYTFIFKSGYYFKDLPTDSTAEYINGTHSDFVTGEYDGKPLSSGAVTGLCCVTVLVGIFDITDGTPIAGVISQPFARRLQQQ